MQPLFQHGSRSAIAQVLQCCFARAINGTSVAVRQRAFQDPSVCFGCQARSLSSKQVGLQKQLIQTPRVHPTLAVIGSARAFSDKPPSSSEPSEAPSSSKTDTTINLPPPRIESSSPPKLDDTVSARLQPAKDDPPPTDHVHRVADEDLPSHHEKQRWSYMKRFSELMETLQEKIGVATQKVNTYTGTDYSGIEALRREIEEQEQLVKTRRTSIEKAKNELEDALANGASAQKEVVALLERKHSWSAGDLERYMSLIRSEHVNDQAVQNAKEKVSIAEQNLEEARQQLEKRERQRYHEEQIWSDTIRRNSTWVTIGLMGLNSFLLLLSLIIIEPWRRRRLVREFKNALEERTPAVNPAPITTSSASASLQAVEAQIDSVIEPASAPAEVLPEVKEDSPVLAESIATGMAQNTTEEDKIIPAVLPAPQEEANVPLVDTALLDDTASTPTQLKTDLLGGPPRKSKGRFRNFYDESKLFLLDLFSERVVSVRQVDLTAVALEGVIFGATLCGLFMMLLNRR